MKIIRICSVLFGVFAWCSTFAEVSSTPVWAVADQLKNQSHRSETDKVGILSLYLAENYDQKSLLRLKDQLNVSSSYGANEIIESNRARHFCGNELKQSRVARQPDSEKSQAKIRSSIARKNACEKSHRKKSHAYRITKKDIRQLARKILASS